MIHAPFFNLTNKCHPFLFWDSAIGSAFLCCDFVGKKKMVHPHKKKRKKSVSDSSGETTLTTEKTSPTFNSLTEPTWGAEDDESSLDDLSDEEEVVIFSEVGMWVCLCGVFVMIKFSFE